jgi:hypothetical protein
VLAGPCAQVSVGEEEEEFQTVVTAALSVLILGTETKLDAALAHMTRLPWASLEAVRFPPSSRPCNLQHLPLLPVHTAPSTLWSCEEHDAVWLLILLYSWLRLRSPALRAWHA